MTNESQTSRTECPPIEEIAALLDGRLEGHEREQVVEHIGQCEACYEVFTETLRFQEEEAEKGKVIEHPAARRRFVWSAASAVAAAALALIVAVPMWLGMQIEVGSIDVGRLADRLAAGTEAAVLETNAYSGDGWSRTRGFGSGLNETQRAFRLGVRTVDLDIALRAGDRQRAERLVQELYDMASDLPLAEMILVSYDDLLERLQGGETPESLTERSAAAASLTADAATEPYYSLGQWAEAGLLASSAGDRAFLGNRRTRRFLTELELAELPEELHPPLAMIAERLDRGVDESDLPPLAEAFGELVELGGNV